MRFTRLISTLLLSLVGMAASAQGITTVQDVNVGTGPNTGTGEGAYTAFTKINNDVNALFKYNEFTMVGPVTMAAGTNTSVITPGAIVNSFLAPMTADTIKCNPLSLATSAQDCTPAQVAAMLSPFIATSGGGSSNITSVSVTALPWETVSPTICTTGACAFSITSQASLPANQILATPCGANGSVGLRYLCSGDLPNYSGDVVSSQGVMTIQPGVVSLADMAQMPATSVPCNYTTSQATAVYCTPGQLATMIGAVVSGGGASSSLTNQIDACTYAGVDATGANDSHNAVKTMFAQYSNTNYEIEVDCPIMVHVGNDPTLPIMMPPNLDVKFGPNGMFIFDNLVMPSFVWNDVAVGTWTNAQFEWIGTVPLTMTATLDGNYSAWNDGMCKQDLITNHALTLLTGGSCVYDGTVNGSAMLMFKGAHDGYFYNMHLFAPQTANASQFIVTAMAIEYQWSPGATITNNNVTVTAPNGNSTKNLNFYGTVIDGADMGVVGQGTGANFFNTLGLRYSDVQDASYLTNGVGGSQGGATCAAGTCWMAPPHLFYVQLGDGSLNTKLNIINTIDMGYYVGGTKRRSTNSGSLLSLKIDLGNGAVVDGYVSHRPDGYSDVINNFAGNLGGTMRNVWADFNSQTLTVDGTTVWGWRFPSSNPYIGQSYQNINIRDLATEPTNYPIVGPGYSTNQDLTFSGIRVFMNDVPGPSTFHPSATFAGTNISVEIEDHFANYNQTDTFRGPAVNANASALCTNCNIDVKVFGWRQPTITFSAIPQAGATTAVLASSWPFSTCTCSITFPDGEVRYALLSNNQTSVGAFAALTATQATALATGGNLLTANFNGYKPRILINNAYGSFFSRVHVLDVSNGYEATNDSGILTESWTQFWQGTPTGNQQSTFITYPNTFAIDRDAIAITTALGTTNGLTGMNLGTGPAGAAGSVAALLRSNIGVTSGTNPVLPIFAPISLTMSPSVFYLFPLGGNFGTTGAVTISVRGTQVSAGS